MFFMKAIVFDVETKKSFDEVGGRNNLEALGVSVIGAYFYETGEFKAFEEGEISVFAALLKKTDLVIGFNIRNFDYPVLQPHLKDINFASMPTLDIFTDVTAKLGHRISLNALASATLGIKKSSDGLQALKWYKEGKMQEIKDYCLKDVAITKDLYEYGKEHGNLLFESIIDGKVKAVPVSWLKSPNISIFKTVEDAFKNRQRLLIEYVSRSREPDEDFKKMRKIDVYEIRRGEVSAYCHLRQAVRNFKLESILAAEPVMNEFYKTPQDRQATLF